MRITAQVLKDIKKQLKSQDESDIQAERLAELKAIKVQYELAVLANYKHTIKPRQDLSLFIAKAHLSAMSGSTPKDYKALKKEIREAEKVPITMLEVPEWLSQMAGQGPAKASRVRRIA